MAKGSVKEAALTIGNPIERNPNIQKPVVNYDMGRAMKINEMYDHPAITKDFNSRPEYGSQLGVGCLYCGWSAYTTSTHAVGIIDQTNSIVEIPHKTTSVLSRKNQVVISYRYKYSTELPISDLEQVQLIIDLDKLEEEGSSLGKCIYVPEVNGVIGTTHNLEKDGVSHPSAIDEYASLIENISDMSGVITPGSGFEIRVNLDKNLPEECLHDVMYIAMPWMTDPIAIAPTRLTMTTGHDITVRVFTKAPVILDKEITEEYNQETIHVAHVEAMTATAWRDIPMLDGRIKWIMSPSRDIVRRKLAQYKAEYRSTIMSIEEHDLSVEKAIHQSELRVKEIEENAKEERERFKRKEATYKDEIESLQTTIQRFKSTVELKKHDVELRKLEADEHNSNSRVIQERHKVRQIEVRNTTETWKMAVAISSAIVSLATLGATLYIASTKK